MVCFYDFSKSVSLNRLFSLLLIITVSLGYTGMVVNVINFLLHVPVNMDWSLFVVNEYYIHPLIMLVSLQ